MLDRQSVLLSPRKTMDRTGHVHRGGETLGMEQQIMDKAQGYTETASRL